MNIVPAPIAPETITWTIHRPGPPESQRWLAGFVTRHRGCVPRLFLPSGGVDLIFSDGEPLPAPWSRATTVVQINREVSVPVPTSSTQALRVPLQIGVFEALCALQFPPHDGLYPLPERLEQGLRSTQTSEVSFDPRLIVEYISDSVNGLPAALRRALTDLEEIIEIAERSSVTSVEQWGVLAGTRVRNIERLLQRCAGISPKRFLRVLRVNRTVQAMLTDRPLAEIAMDCDFADQSHMSRECRDLTGMTARELRWGVREKLVFVRDPLPESRTA